MNPIDEIIRETLTVPQDDQFEHDGLQIARSALIAAQANQPVAATRRPRMRRWATRGARLVPATLVCALVVAIGVLLLLHNGSDDLSGVRVQTPAAARALVSDLAVLRRPQTSADRLPQRVSGQWTRYADGSLVPGLTRLISSDGPIKLYLAVIDPPSDATALWPPDDGDQVTVVAVTPLATSATEPIPAKAIDADIVAGVGARFAGGGASATAKIKLSDWTVIVPDGVTSVRWVSPGPASTLHKAISVTVQNNVATTTFSEFPRQPAADWYSANGHAVATHPQILTREVSEQQRRVRQRALSIARHEHHTAPKVILNAFKVFRYSSARGARLSDGYIVSRPALTTIPEPVLSLAEYGSPDLRQTREVQSSSGLSMFIVPSASGICLYVPTGTTAGARPTSLTGGGASGGCSNGISHGLKDGVGEASGGSALHGHQINYGILPDAHLSQKITISHGRTRTIHPPNGVYIIQPDRDSASTGRT